MVIWMDDLCGWMTCMEDSCCLYQYILQSEQSQLCILFMSCCRVYVCRLFFVWHPFVIETTGVVPVFLAGILFASVPASMG